jgi:RHS repeat-associated protein
VMRTTYDALGRTTKTVENYVNGTVSDGDDKTTEFAYNAAGMTSLSAKLTGGGVQTTEWVYGVTQGSGSAVDSNDVVGATRWPDPSSGAASSGQQETTTVNALGQTLTMSDRNGSTHTLTMDVLGRVVSDAVTTLGSGVDGGVRRIETAYDGQGNAYLVTSYDAASGGSVVNQVQRAFNGLGQLVTEYQEHGGAVNTSTSAKVQYAWSEMASGANHSRLTSVTYASGYVLTYNYASGLNSDVSRLTSLSDANGTLESYDHLGFGTVVRRGHSQPNVDLSFIKRSGESNTDAGDQYTGLDRFGRVVDQRWMDATSGTAKDRLGYTYDAMGNRTARTNAVNSSFDESYTYDGLNQLLSFARGSDAQSYDFDAVGNWESVTTNGSTQTRGHNKQNEITSVSGATTPTFDANGNMTGDETGRQFVYDAWNRMVEVKNSGGTSLKTFEFDGLNRRISETASGTTRDLYYSAQWQVLEERVSGNTERRYVWSPVYVDALVLRDRDTDANGSLDERLYVVQDANFNVVALLDTSGNVVERFTYTPFGVQTVYDANWSVRGGGSAYSFTHGFQGMAFDSVAGLNPQRYRWYSPTLGRWVTVDWIRYDAGDVNLYRAMSNNTVVNLDPTGLKDGQKMVPGVVALSAANLPLVTKANVCPKGWSLVERTWSEPASSASRIDESWKVKDNFSDSVYFVEVDYHWVQIGFGAVGHVGEDVQDALAFILEESFSLQVGVGNSITVSGALTVTVGRYGETTLSIKGEPGCQFMAVYLAEVARHTKERHKFGKFATGNQKITSETTQGYTGHKTLVYCKRCAKK